MRKPQQRHLPHHADAHQVLPAASNASLPMPPAAPPAMSPPIPAASALQVQHSDARNSTHAFNVRLHALPRVTPSLPPHPQARISRRHPPHDSTPPSISAAPPPDRCREIQGAGRARPRKRRHISPSHPASRVASRPTASSRRHCALRLRRARRVFLTRGGTPALPLVSPLLLPLHRRAGTSPPSRHVPRHAQLPTRLYYRRRHRAHAASVVHQAKLFCRRYHKGTSSFSSLLHALARVNQIPSFLLRETRSMGAVGSKENVVSNVKGIQRSLTETNCL